MGPQAARHDVEAGLGQRPGRGQGKMVFIDRYPETYRLIQNEGRGLMMHGCRDWTDYQVSATMTPHMCKAGGLGARVQGMKRHYALLCDEEGTRLVSTLEGEDTVLAEAGGGWTLGNEHQLALKVEGNSLVRLSRWQAGGQSGRSGSALQRRRHRPGLRRGPHRLRRCPPDLERQSQQDLPPSTRR